MCPQSQAFTLSLAILKVGFIPRLLPFPKVRLNTSYSMRQSWGEACVRQWLLMVTLHMQWQSWLEEGIHSHQANPTCWQHVLWKVKVTVTGSHTTSVTDDLASRIVPEYNHNIPTCFFHLFCGIKPCPQSEDNHSKLKIKCITVRHKKYSV